MVKNRCYSPVRFNSEAYEDLILGRIPYASKLLEVRGLNATSVAGVLGEAGDLSGYAHGNTLLRHAGLNLAEASSGKWHGKMVLSKRGRPLLRCFLYLMAMCMVMTNSDIRALHHHNVEVKKLKNMKSIMKLCGKVARMLVALANGSKAYYSTKVFPQAARSHFRQLMYSQDDKKQGVSEDITQKGSDTFR